MSSQVVPRGYKATKVGVIPEDWEVVQIKDVTSYVDYRGKTPKKVYTGILLVTAKNIKQGYLDYKTSREYIAEDDYQNVMSRGTPNLGDVLLTTEAPLGNIAQIDNENIALAQRVIKFRGKDNLDNTYLKYHFLSEIFQAYLYRLAIGTTVLGIQGKQLHKMLIPLPPLKEQEKISNILTTWDDTISKQNELIKAKEELKKGLMQKLLSGEVRFSGFEDEWKYKKLSMLCQIKKGQQLNKSTLSDIGEYPAINGGINPSGYTNNYNTHKDTITISEGGNSCGYVNYITTKFWSGGHCYSLLNLTINSYYLYQYLKLFELNIMRLRVGSGLPNIQKGDIENLKINLPSLQEQEKIAEVLSNADKEIDLLKNELEELKEQKKGLMQKLLTGEVRGKDE